MPTRMSSKPLIVICGTTGVGKSKLGIELALALARNRQNHPYNGARIINADSMQVYTGMDVITNKVPMAERCGVEHLLMDYKKPGEQLTGPEWIKDAIEAVRSMKIPLCKWCLWLVRSRRRIATNRYLS